MIRKNEEGKFAMDVSAVLQVLVILGGLTVFYFQTNNDIKETVWEIRLKNSQQDSRISVNEKSIAKIERELE